ncbi:molybdopterin molybdotransferase MoeA [Brachybacterium saurashtrense]|uniref:Molybdopterin molybdenumtransferase n=1 Tax=Brachybacterium saurashtrense TaxID=556288 RepID=A0A345YKH5_9MICO|nr:molybdopterin molybdotransferase MoeA [Brachybacterium saurashtrense]AXK44427.1 molybdopterin molybdenumtransferase MoeA [Brachybacterium saurashtrense]RRR23039.1 molybdopterin molybdenumtransferase MoeA [Brachybacterium saurashtrense]
MSTRRPTPVQWREELLAAISLDRSAERLPLEKARGMVLAAPVRSPEALPPVPLAAMDGFAVRRAELTAPGTTTLPVLAELPARPGAVGPLPPGAAARIMTGAPVPRGADAVIEVEATDADPFGPVPAEVALTLPDLPVPGRHVRAPGEEIAAGAVLAESGDRVGAGLLGLARTLGIAHLDVQRRVRVAVVVTGDELAPAAGTGAGPAPAVGAVRESNGAMLTTALAVDGAAPLPARRCGDRHEELRRTLADAAAEADLVLTTGGIGHGAFDVVKTLLGSRGSGTSRFAHLALRPGGPQGHGTLPGGVPVVHLPGTPVGAFVGYHLFVRPLLLGGAAAPRRVRWADVPGGTAPREPSRAGRSGGVHAQPGRLGRAADGAETVALLPGSRLAPYGRADAIVLCEAAGGGAHAGNDDGTVLVLPLTA